MKGISILSECNAKEKVWSGVLSVFTLFALLSFVAPGWYGQMPSYSEWICGLTTWSGYNKQADMRVIQSILLGLPVLFLCFSFLLVFWKKKIQADNKEKMGLFFNIGYLLALGMFFAGKEYALCYLAVWTVLVTGYILLCFSDTKKSNNPNVNQVFETLVRETVYFYMAMISLLLMGNIFVPGIGAVWQQYAWVLLILAAILFLILCGNRFLRARSHYLEGLQLLLPFAWIGFAHFRYRYEKDGALMELFYSGRWKWFCFLMCAVFLVWAWISWIEQKQEKKILLPTFLITALLRVFSQPDGILSVDYFHNGEISMPMQQWITYGKLPYEDLIPIHGMCDYFYGAVNYLFFDGTYMSLNAAIVVGNLFMTILLAFVIYFFVENEKQGFYLLYFFMPFMIQTAGMRYLFVFILFIVLFSNIVNKGLESLYVWILLSIFAIGWNAAVGGATALAFLPVILYRGKRDIPGQLKEFFKTIKQKKTSGDRKRVGWKLAAWAVLFGIGLCFIPMFLQIVIYLKDNTGTTLYVNGMEMLEDISGTASYFVPELIGEHSGFFLTAFGFLLPLIVSFVVFLENKKVGEGEFFVTLFLGLWVLANYSFVRYDEGLRSKVLAIFFLLLLAVTLLYRQRNANHMWILYLSFWCIALYLAADSPVVTPKTLEFEQKIPAYVDTVIAGKEIEDPVVYVTGESVDIPNLGNGFVLGNTLVSLQNIQKVLKAELTEGRTCFDITNGIAHAVIFDLPSYLPFTSVYNISNAALQNKAISLLESKLPDILLAAPCIQFDEAPFSFRSMELYRYLMKQGYVPYKYENVIYLVRGESYMKESGQDWEAWAQLMHKTSLSGLPAVWGANMENIRNGEAWKKNELNAKILPTETGFEVIFAEPVNGKEIDMLLLRGIVCEEIPEGQKVGVSRDKEKKPEISMWLKSDISSEGVAEYRFSVWQGKEQPYILPVCNSPYFTGENAIEKLSFEWDKDYDISTENIEISGIILP